MTPAVFWILVGFICLLIGTLIIYWATRRHDGIEPDSRPVNLRAPTQEELAIIMHEDISYLDWLDMNGPQQAAARDAYYNSRRF